MNNDLKYLSKLIDMVENEGNDHNKRKLWSLIGVLAKKETGELSEKEAHRVISEMHELNMEQIIKIQASSFYNYLPLPEQNLKVLINDFIDMEHCRRRNDFEGFALAVYQQIENIVNYLYSKYNLEKDFLGKRENPCLTIKHNYFGDEKNKRPETLLYEIIFRPPYKNYITQNILTAEERKNHSRVKLNQFLQISKLDFLDKTRIVLYFIYFDGKLNNYDKWNELNNTLITIQFSRNGVHRNISFEVEDLNNQKGKKDYSYLNYLLFQGFISDFINIISTRILKKSTIR